MNFKSLKTTTLAAITCVAVLGIIAIMAGCSNKADEKMAEDVAAIRAIKEKEQSSKDEQLAKQKRNQQMREEAASKLRGNITETGR
jgi:hypothetical protein